MRGQNFFIAYSDAADGAEFKRKNQVDEYMLILPDKESTATLNGEIVKRKSMDLVLSSFPQGKARLR